WLMMSLWDALRMNMMISYQELVRTFLSEQLDRHTGYSERTMSSAHNKTSQLDCFADRCFKR
ncbi:hypothetical protein, partial [Klebsiella pneumoniae]|uniref:hypothetical protein n=1 Tax=Klebsiella pneumoniae TaxID=573 RepID=UPI000ADBAC0E